MKKPRFVYKDVPTDDEFIEMMKEINQRPCVFYDEPRYEEIEHINKVKLSSDYYLDEVIRALLQEGYELTLKKGDTKGEVIITWKDKPDRVDEMVQKIEEML